MNAVLRDIVFILVLCSVVVFGTACGGSDTAENAADLAAVDTNEPSASSEPADGDSGKAAAPASEAVSVAEAFKAMAASEGIYFGEVPEGFPLDIIPVHPDGEIDKSSIDEDGFTLLQNVGKDSDSVMAYFRKHYEELGWSAGSPFTMGERTILSFEGPDGGVDMTVIDHGDGSTFVALALSR